MTEYRTRPAAGGYDLLADGQVIGWAKTPEQAGDKAEEHRQSQMAPDAAAFRRIYLMAYAGVGDTSTSMGRDYERMDSDLRLIAELAGVTYETPDYVRDLIEMNKEVD